MVMIFALLMTNSVEDDAKELELNACIEESQVSSVEEHQATALP